jgi:dethiobiotin synthetase
MAIIFITGIGTGIGKTVISAILAQALEADYWKPVQAGYADGTDSEWVQNNLSNGTSRVYPEVYKLLKPVSPHIAAREENINISIEKICDSIPENKRNLIVEGAGGLLSPITEKKFVSDLIEAMDAKVILVSRNYLGSINHSLLTSSVCSQKKISVLGWIFNDQYLDYENEIKDWSGYPRIGSVPFSENPGKQFVAAQASLLRKQLELLLC